MKSFIYTNPPKDTKLSAKDKIFVLKIFQESSLGKQDKRPDFSNESGDSWDVPESLNGERGPSLSHIKLKLKREKENVIDQERLYADLREEKMVKNKDPGGFGRGKDNWRRRQVRNKEEALRVTKILEEEVRKVKMDIDSMKTEFSRRNTKLVNNCMQIYRNEKKKLKKTHK